MPQARGEEFFEVDLSEGRDEPRKKDLDNLIEYDFTKERLSFEEKIEACEESLTQLMDEHKVYSFMERRNLLSDDVDITEADFVKSQRKIEKEYVELICKASNEQYRWWVTHTLDTLLEECKLSADPNDMFEKIRLFKEVREERIERAEVSEEH